MLAMLVLSIFQIALLVIYPIIGVLVLIVIAIILLISEVIPANAGWGMLFIAMVATMILYYSRKTPDATTKKPKRGFLNY